MNRKEADEAAGCACGCVGCMLMLLAFLVACKWLLRELLWG